MNQLLNVFNSSSILSRIDLCGTYNLLRIKEDDEHLTAFRTKYGSYEYLVMPFGLTNAPASFQNLVNDIFQDLLAVFVVAYLDDIMVFSKSEEEHVTNGSTVLTRLRANNLFAKASKCLFHLTSVEYLGYVVSSEGLKMNKEKVQQILNWPPPRNLKALQSFLVFSNFYYPFINNYSKKISSLTSFLKKDSFFPLNEEALDQFHLLKESFTTIVETNASDYSLGAVLSQVSASGKRPIAFNSHKLIPEELNYEICDKELLGVFWALKHWRVATLRQASWAEFLSEFHFSITYFLGHLANLPDNVYLERGEEFISKNPMKFQQLIKQDEVQPSRYFAVKVESFSNLINLIQKALWKDSQYRSILQELGKGKSFQDYSLDSSSQLLLFKDWVVVPNDPTIQLSILQKHHDFSLAGHPGQEKTLKLVKWDFHWSCMTQFIKDYVSSYQQCSRNKNIHYKRLGLLKPLPIPNGPWICLSMDFITQLPLSNSFVPILVIVDRFSKMAVFIPTMSSITSLDLAHLLTRISFQRMAFLQALSVREVHFLFPPFGPILVSSSRFQKFCQLLTTKKLMDRQRG
ncbi:hypothetical protein O181_051653 [Austropuccinia psidii MF-1]|uniref:Reverse transcriptase domain-containing protein n=1 Tax=Austropuccinia psidii MF-1 TaxID=1389203 RepID=A0A9Q3E1A3_9BASI|nr:hypothetical protein [Austropuccinia psidii MF-1]